MVACKVDGAERSQNVTLCSCAAYSLGGLRSTVLSAILRYLVPNLPARWDCSLAAGVFIRYIAVLGFQLLSSTRVSSPARRVSIRYIAVLGFQRIRNERGARHCAVSIRYIAVLGFQRRYGLRQYHAVLRLFPSAISRYLVSNPRAQAVAVRAAKVFPSAISRYLVSNALCG